MITSDKFVECRILSLDESIAIRPSCRDAPAPEGPPPRPKLSELIALRKAKYPRHDAKGFRRERLGITRLHMAAIEQGRRAASMELALRWLLLLRRKRASGCSARCRSSKSA